MIPNSVIEELLQAFTWGIVVVDEAYIDFSGTPSACYLIDKYPNVVVLQTLSKVLCLHTHAHSVNCFKFSYFSFFFFSGIWLGRN